MSEVAQANGLKIVGGRVRLPDLRIEYETREGERTRFDPTPEEQNVILIYASALRTAERMIESCEYCNPDGAEIPFD